ncbi:hypothetical protein HMPREF9440_01326 [Sutterella parvirubra YIT 11816]|uniref:Uncharacterized protein n=1 Tax=Sutterella parvirubra YIT 11816 TaxID=762967 RepID=H3KF10_9BURK|nr:hypothetical protein HMPREF9440_01326 [Sutterella parvirubra YIT 11816]
MGSSDEDVRICRALFSIQALGPKLKRLFFRPSGKPRQSFPKGPSRKPKARA